MLGISWQLLIYTYYQSIICCVQGTPKIHTPQIYHDAGCHSPRATGRLCPYILLSPWHRQCPQGYSWWSGFPVSPGFTGTLTNDVRFSRSRVISGWPLHASLSYGYATDMKLRLAAGACVIPKMMSAPLWFSRLPASPSRPSQAQVSSQSQGPCSSCSPLS